MDPRVADGITDRHAAGRTAAGDAAERVSERSWIRARTDRPYGAVPGLDERRTAIGRANGNAVGRRAARHAMEEASARARTGDKRPCRPVPGLGQRLLGDLVEGPAHGHTTIRGSAGHAEEPGAVDRIRAVGNGPARAVPDLDKRGIRRICCTADAHRHARLRAGARDTEEK